VVDVRALVPAARPDAAPARSGIDAPPYDRRNAGLAFEAATGLLLALARFLAAALLPRAHFLGVRAQRLAPHGRHFPVTSIGRQRWWQNLQMNMSGEAVKQQRQNATPWQSLERLAEV